MVDEGGHCDSAITQDRQRMDDLLHFLRHEIAMDGDDGELAQLALALALWLLL